MLMSPSWRRATLVVHLLVSVGWIGAVLAYMSLDLSVTFTNDVATLRAGYIAMSIMTKWAIVPLAYATLASGLVMSLGTKWGLFRHYWVIISLVLTVFALTILLIETRTIEAYAEMAAEPSTSDAALQGLGGTLVHSVGGTMVLLVVMILNIYKPRGVTPYGWRKQQEERAAL